MNSQHRRSSTRGTSPKLGWNMCGVALLSRQPAICLKWGNIGPRLLLMTNRKLHTIFRLVPTANISALGWMTLKGRNALCFKTHAFSESTTIIWMKIDPYYQRRICNPTANDCRFWQYKVCADICGGFLETGRQTTVSQSKTSIFRAFRRYVYGTLRNEANIIIHV